MNLGRKQAFAGSSFDRGFGLALEAVHTGPFVVADVAVAVVAAAGVDVVAFVE